MTKVSVEELPSGLIFLDLEFPSFYIVVEYFFRENMLGLTPFQNDEDDLDILAKSFSNPEFATEYVEEAIQQIAKLIQDFQSL